MKKYFTIPLFLFSFLVSFSQINGTITHDGVLRSYILRLPPGFNASNPTPLVFNLHGYSSNASQQQFYSAMNLVADTAGFIVCYPDGLSSAWNSGWVGAYGTGVDDVGFISALIDKLHNDYNIDQSRVYSCGMSNGGFQSYRMACELENKICAIASVTGAFTDSVAFYCNPSRAVPVLEIHGTSDNTVNYSGGPFYLGIEETVGWWINRNQCMGMADTFDVPNTNLLDSTTAQIISYTNCLPNSQVKLIKVFDGGHTWPGASLNLSGLGYGLTNYDINANIEIWNFFRQFSLPSAVNVHETANDEKPVVFPTVFSNEINVQNSNESVTWHLFNSLGQKMLTFIGNEKINTETFSKGSFVLVGIGKNDRFTFKLVKE